MDKLELLLAALAAAGHIVNRGVSDYNGMAWTAVLIRGGAETTEKLVFFDNDFLEILEIAKQEGKPIPYEAHVDYTHQD